MNTKKGNTAIVVAIIAAGLIIAGAVMFTNRTDAPTAPQANNNNGNSENSASNVRPVDESDWVYGSRDAEITIVEYSDTECPFCSRLHPTLKQIVDDYDGQVNWVYRHFPLVQLHPIAPTVAHATECVGELAGNDAFWTFTNKVYAESGANGGTDTNQLVSYAGEAGVSEADFNSCMEESRHQDKVEEDFRNAVESGGTGTPYSIIISGDETIPVEGAQPIQNWKAIIDSQLEG